MLTPEEEAELAALDARFGKESSTLGDFAGGLKHSLDRTAYGIKTLLPQAVQNFGDRLDRQLGLGGLDKAKYEAGKEFVKNAGPAANIGDITGDVLLGLASGGAISRGGALLKNALASKGIANLGAQFGTEILGNAALNAAISPEDRGLGAALGAGGAVAGAGINRVLSGPLAKAVTPEARRMMDRGIGLTGGQMVSGSKANTLAKVSRGLEDSATAIPLVGDVIKHRSIGAIEDWNRVELNKALQGTGITVKNVGVTGFDEARDALRTKFDSIIEHITVQPTKAKELLDDLSESLGHLPLLNAAQRKYLSAWVNLHLGKHVSSDTPIEGRIARTIDRGIAEEITKWETRGSAWDQSMVDALEQIQGGWRSLLEASPDKPEVVEELQKLIQAQDNLAFLKKASDKTASGVFAPIQLQRVYERANRPFSQTLKDAKLTLPTKVPETGSAERAMLYHAMSPKGVSATATGAGLLTGFGPLTAAAAGLGAAYTKTGTKYLGSGVVKPVARTLGSKISPDELEYLVKLLSTQGSRATLNDYNEVK